MNGYITLDYELGMGVTGTPERCLIESMNHLTAMTDKYEVKMNVFVDAAYLLQLRKLKDLHPQLLKDYETVTNHVKKLDGEGHAIQLHLHPQWSYSAFDGEKWILDKEHYKLSDMPLEDQKKLIIEGTRLLNGFITHPVKAFRAGGFSVENFSDLYETFLSVGINTDSSVLSGVRHVGRWQNYDYRDVPKKTSYRISYNHKKEDREGSMMEYPLTTQFIPYVVHFYNKFIHAKDNLDDKPSKKKWGDGAGIGIPGSKFNQVKKRLGRFFTKVSISACIEEAYGYESVLRYSKRHYVGEDFVIIGHPKFLSPYSVAVLEHFIKKHPEIEYKTFK